MRHQPETVLPDPERLAVLRGTAPLDTPADATFDRLACLAARLFGAPVPNRPERRLRSARRDDRRRGHGPSLLRCCAAFERLYRGSEHGTDGFGLGLLIGAKPWRLADIDVQASPEGETIVKLRLPPGR